MKAAARRLERLTASLPAAAVTKLAITMIDRLVTGEADDRALSDLERRVGELDTRERTAHRDTCLLANYLSQHTAEANARVAAWVSQIAGRVSELTALDDARRFLSVVQLDTAERMEDVREGGDAERLAFCEDLAAQHRDDAQRLNARWIAALEELRALRAKDPIPSHRALLAMLETQVGPEAIPARVRKPIEVVDGARSTLPETIALFENCDARFARYAAAGVVG